ncbi:MAG TPA: O-antigen ligase family protein [Vicinamibacterales bacterium]|nr:O-antigen ligase family protein [Vicinamibacterales bacterium]
MAREADRAWDPLMICIAGYVLVAVGRVHQLFPILGVIRPAALLGALAIVLFFSDRRDVRRLSRISVPTTWFVVALLVWMTLSTTGAMVLGTSFDLLTGNFIKTFLMFLVIAAGVRGIRDVERLAITYLFAATIYAAVVLLRFDLGEADAWRLDDLYYYDANDLATFVVTAMPIALFVLHGSRLTYGRALGVTALALLTLVFVNTGSRGGFVALLGVVAFVNFGYRAIALRRRVGATALVALVLLAAASERYWTQMGTIVSDSDYTYTSESGRMQIWQRGIGYMLKFPVFGVGPNNFGAAEGRLSPFAQRGQYGVGVRWNAAHNSYVQAGAELGIPGLMLFVGMIVSGFVVLRRATRRGSAAFRAHRGPELTQALTASLTGFAVGAFFLSLAYSEILFTLLALAVALHKVATAPVSHAALRS